MKAIYLFLVFLALASGLRVQKNLSYLQAANSDTTDTVDVTDATDTVDTTESTASSVDDTTVDTADDTASSADDTANSADDTVEEEAASTDYVLCGSGSTACYRSMLENGECNQECSTQGCDFVDFVDCAAENSN